MAKDDKYIDEVNKLKSAIDRGGSESKILTGLRERVASAEINVTTQATTDLAERAKESLRIASHKLIEEQAFRTSRSRDQIESTLAAQFSPREYARQEHVNMRSGDIPISQHSGLGYAQLKQQEYRSRISSAASAAEARKGIEPGLLYTVNKDTKEPELIDNGAPYRAVLELQENQTRESAGIGLALQNRRQEGRDPNSMLATGGKLLAREQSRLENVGIKEDVKSGKYSDPAEEAKKLSDSGNKLAETMKKLSDAFAKFDKTSDESVKTLSKAEKEFEQVTKEYEKQSKIVKEIKAQGGQGGQGVSSAIGVATSAMDLAKYQFVTSNIQQNNLRASIAGATNEQFFDQVNASKGDAGALRRMSTGFHQYANKQYLNF
jgi:hypothetical protein